ncbi:hypothetical protein [Portibacter lacus]|nr:hypothetical protein [Portibacter lacus]
MIFCINLSPAYGQLNLKIGYNLDYSAYSGNNEILSSYNTANPTLADPFKDLHFFNGLQLGLRLRGEYVGMDFTWERSSAKKFANGIDVNEVLVSKELDYTANKFALGLESYNKYFGIGANVYWEKLNIASPIENFESSVRVFNNDRLGNRVYLILVAPGSDRLSISLQPYISIPWSHYNLGSLAQNLGVSTKNGAIQENLHFGFSIVFYNGPQND